MNYDIENLRKFLAPEFVFGIGARFLAGQYVKNLGGRKVLLVTDPGVIEAGWARQVIDALESERIPLSVYHSVTSNPKDHEIMEGVRQYREGGCNCVVAVGGGSPMDCAKGIGIISTNGGHIRDFEGIDRVPMPCPPLIFLPTTAGTAADVSQFAIITHSDERYKMAIISKAVVPDVSLTDPEMTTTLTPELTLRTGLDALTLAIEALASNASSPITDVHALESARLVFANLEHAWSNPQDIDHRIQMSLASLQAGLAFSNASLGAVHAMAHALGGLIDAPHGQCNALLLPPVIRYNNPGAKSDYGRLARALGLEPEACANESERLELLPKTIEEFANRMGRTGSLRDMGVNRSDIGRLARIAMRDPCIVTNPVQPTPYDLEKIYDDAF